MSTIAKLYRFVNSHYFFCYEKVSTLEAATSGSLSGAEGFTTQEDQELLNRIEKQLKRRFAVGSQVSEDSIIKDFVKQKYPQPSVQKVIFFMIRRGELQHRMQRKMLYRLKWIPASFVLSSKHLFLLFKHSPTTTSSFLPIFIIIVPFLPCETNIKQPWYETCFIVPSSTVESWYLTIGYLETFEIWAFWRSDFKLRGFQRTGL